MYRKQKTKAVTVRNPRTGETWICEDYSQRRTVDGIEFIEVHKPDSQRTVWISAGALVKSKEVVKNV